MGAGEGEKEEGRGVRRGGREKGGKEEERKVKEGVLKAAWLHTSLPSWKG